MDRRDFLNQLGIGAAFVLTTACLGSCKSDTTTVDPVDFIIDLTASEFSALRTNGGYVIKNSAVIARTTSGNYAAATVKCSHEGDNQIVYKTGEWYCNSHGARFSEAGAGLNSNASKGLTIFKTTLTGNSLRIYS